LEVILVKTMQAEGGAEKTQKKEWKAIEKDYGTR